MISKKVPINISKYNPEKILIEGVRMILFNAFEPPQCETRPQQLISCNQEAWALKRLEELIELNKSILLNRIAWPSASEIMVNEAINGAINGVAIEIIRMLGLAPCYINIRARKN